MSSNTTIQNFQNLYKAQEEALKAVDFSFTSYKQDYIDNQGFIKKPLLKVYNEALKAGDSIKKGYAFIVSIVNQIALKIFGFFDFLSTGCLQKLEDTFYPINSINGKRHFVLLPLSWENTLGEKLYKILTSDLEKVDVSFYRRTDVNETTNTIIQNIEKANSALLQNASEQKINYHVEDIHSSCVNAFSVAGGGIVVYEGILNKIKKPDNPIPYSDLSSSRIAKDPTSQVNNADSSDPFTIKSDGSKITKMLIQQTNDTIVVYDKSQVKDIQVKDIQIQLNHCSSIVQSSNPIERITINSTMGKEVYDRNQIKSTVIQLKDSPIINYSKREIKSTMIHFPDGSAVWVDLTDISEADAVAALLGNEMTRIASRHSLISLIGRLINWVSVRLGVHFLIERLKMRDQEYQDPKNDPKKLWVLKAKYDLISDTALWIGDKLQYFYELFNSSSNEYEADCTAICLANNAGYNPLGALYLQEVLSRQENSLNPWVPWLHQKAPFLFTHPHAENRKAAIFAAIQSFDKKEMDAMKDKGQIVYFPVQEKDYHYDRNRLSSGYQFAYNLMHPVEPKSNGNP